MTEKRSIVSRIITVICILLIIGSGIMIFLNLWPKFKAQQTFEEIQDVAITTNNNQETIDWEALKAINPEVVGWIKVPGTHINYPVVQTSDNDYYLTHTFDNQYSGYGTPFLDTIYDFNRDPVAQNSVIYAHSSTYGDQVGFEGLDKFEDEAYYRDHPYIYYTTEEDGSIPIQYEIVAVLKEDKDYDYRRPDFADQADFLNYYNNILADSLYSTGKYVLSNDEMVTLSTCVFDVSGARVAIIARRVNPDPKKQTNTATQNQQVNSNKNNINETIDILNSPEIAESGENL